MTEYTKENHWYGWNGGECPVHPKTQVDVVFGEPASKPFYSHLADNIYWELQEGLSDIIAFRITKLHREPREFWITNNGAFAHDSLEEAQKSPHVEKHGYVHVREVLE